MQWVNYLFYFRQKYNKTPYKSITILLLLLLLQLLSHVYCWPTAWNVKRAHTYTPLQLYRARTHTHTHIPHSHSATDFYSVYVVRRHIHNAHTEWHRKCERSMYSTALYVNIHELFDAFTLLCLKLMTILSTLIIIMHWHSLLLFILFFASAKPI